MQGLPPHFYAIGKTEPDRKPKVRPTLSLNFVTPFSVNIDIKSIIGASKMRHIGIRDSLIGIWQLVSYEAQDAQGTISNPLGENLLGLLCYTKHGFISMQVMREDRPVYSSSDLHISRMEKMAVAASGYVAYAGRFSIDEAAATVTHHVRLSLSPTWVGTDQTRTVALRAGRLYLKGGFVKVNGSLQAPQTVWEKVPS
jgi:lipocalin-like protein